MQNETDRDAEALFQKAVERRLLSQEDARTKLAAIGRTTTWERFSNVDLAIELDLNVPMPRRPKSEADFSAGLQLGTERHAMPTRRQDPLVALFHVSAPAPRGGAGRG